MKKVSLFALAAAGLFLGACSENDEVLNGSQTVEANGSSFVGVSIQMPSASNTTRANDDLNNGTADEFEVKEAYLLLFKGNEEASAVYLDTWSLTNDFQDDTEGATDNGDPQKAIMGENGGTGVTQTSVSVAKIDDLKLLPSENLYAYVIINPANDNMKAKLADGTTFGDFAKKIYSSVAGANNTLGASLEGVIASTGMLMTNSPVSYKQGGSSDPSGAEIISAYKLDQSKIAKTEDEAKNNPAGCIFVERAAAKVTVAESASMTKELDGVKFEIDGWQVINYEPSYYNVRQANVASWLPYFNDFMTTNNAKYRFVSKYDFDPTLPSTAGHTTDGDVYRTYFAQDVQYDKMATLQKTVAIDKTENWLGLNGKAYVPENTFDVPNQLFTNTTQVTLRVKFEGGDLYTISNDATFYRATDINTSLTAKVQAVYAMNQFRENAKEYVLAELKKADDSKYYKATVSISAKVDEAKASNKADYELTYTIACTKSDTEDGTYTEVDTPDLSEALETAWTAAVTSAKKDYTVALYKDGYSYYNVRIQHFGEAETPWDAVAEDKAQTDAYPFKVQPGETTAQIYGYTTDATAQEKANARFLGRYGVVRDNWYQLSIDGVKKLGSAVPEDVSGNTTPDDVIEREYWISAHVHILPWVLRNQNVVL